MHRILLSWLGRTDLRAATESAQVGIGPIAQAMATGRFSRLELLCDYPVAETAPYLAWLRQRTDAQINPGATASAWRPPHRTISKSSPWTTSAKRPVTKPKTPAINPDFEAILEPCGEGAADFLLSASLYHAGKISVGKAAELSGLRLLASHERLREHFGYAVVITEGAAREDLDAVAELSDTDQPLRGPANARRLLAAIAGRKPDRDTEGDPPG